MDGADLNRRALARMWGPVKRHGGKFMVTIHDSNKFRLPGRPEEHKAAINEIAGAMESAGEGWRVPVYVSRECYTTNWSEADDAPT